MGRRVARRPSRIQGPWLAVAVITAAGLGLRAAIPPIVVWNSPHDDEALMNIAASIMRGEWLGTWGIQQVPHTLLAKSPGYSIFLAATHWTGLGPQVITYGVYLVGALLLATTLHPQLGRRWFVAFYALLALNPIVFSPLFSRVYRDQLTASLALLALGLGAHLAHQYSREGPWRPRHHWATVANAALLGVVIGWLSITRGDTVWVVLAAVGAFVAGMLPAVRRLSRTSWIRIGGGAALVAVLATAAPVGVAMLNQHYYSVRLVEDYSAGTFADAVTLWASVKVEGSDDFQLVSSPQRAAVYAVSPSARLVQPLLEDQDNRWIAHNCTWQRDVATVCNDYGAYFAWALRDAAFRAASMSTAAEFQAYFASLADEIEAACDSGELTCGRRGLSPDVPPLDRVSLRVVLANLAGHINGAVHHQYSSGPYRLPGAEEEAMAWARTVNTTDTVPSLLKSGNHPSIMAQTNVITLLRTLYAWLTIPLFAVAVIGLFTKTMWGTSLGRLALVALGGWLTNLLIVSLFYAGSNRTGGNAIALYTMASQSYLIAGLALTTAGFTRTLTPRLRKLAVGRKPPTVA